MKVYRSLQSYEQGKNAVATIGTYDGLHIGHKTILNRLKESARKIEGETVVISFHPHPRLVLFPETNNLRLLHTLDEKIKMLDELGIDKLLLIPFTRDFSRTSSQSFIKDILVGTVGIAKIVIGYDHHFGKNRTGNIQELQQYEPVFGYEVEEIPAQAIDNANVSSTKIRNALFEGDVETVNSYLGYTYSFTGRVIHGEKLGRTLGYPTANIKVPESWKLIPADGIYFVKIWVDERPFWGMMSIGMKPTVGNFPRGIEVNIFDFDEEIYDKMVRVEMHRYIRPEKKLNGLDELKAIMAEDKKQCLQWIQEIEG